MENNWTHDKEQEISSWINICENYIVAHNAKKEYYRKKLDMFLIGTILISIIVSVFNGISSSSYIKILNIVAAILGGITTGINTYLKQDSPHDKIISHINATREYGKLIIDIKYQLNLKDKHRKDCNDFMKFVMEKMLNIESGENSISIMTNNDKKQINKEIKNNENNENNKINEKDVYKNINLEQEKKQNFELFFKRFPTKNNLMINYQMDRLENA